MMKKVLIGLAIAVGLAAPFALFSGRLGRWHPEPGPDPDPLSLAKKIELALHEGRPRDAWALLSADEKETMKMDESTFVKFYEQMFLPTFTGPSVAIENSSYEYGTQSGSVYRKYTTANRTFGYNINAHTDPHDVDVTSSVISDLVLSTLRARNFQQGDTRKQYFTRAIPKDGPELKAIGIHGSMFVHNDKSYRYTTWEEQINELKKSKPSVPSIGSVPR